MILRISTKLQKKLGVSALPAFSASENPYHDWSSHLFVAERRQYILLTNTATLYSCVFPGRGITKATQFTQQAFTSLRETMQADGFADRFDTHIAPYADDQTFSKALNRQVTGSMSDFIHCAKIVFVEENASLPKVDQFLNHMPMSVLGYGHPREAFAALPVA